MFFDHCCSSTPHVIAWSEGGLARLGFFCVHVAGAGEMEGLGGGGLMFSMLATCRSIHLL